MKINVISDIHCGYNYEFKKIIWNNDDEVDDLRYQKYLDDKRKNPEKYKYDSPILLDCLDEDPIESIDDIKKNIQDTMEWIKSNKNILKDQEQYFFPKKYRCVDVKTTLKMCEFLLEKLSNTLHYTSNVVDMILKIIVNIDNFIYQNINKTTVIQTSYIRKYLYKQNCTFVPAKLESADYLVIAGDLGLDDFYSKVYQEIKNKTKGKFKDVLFVKGNHDYWQMPSSTPFSKLREKINLKDRYLEHVDGNYVFLGCTMWTPIDEEHRYGALRMNDFKYIPGFNIPVQNRLYKEETTWIRKKMEQYKDKKIILVTHHNPSDELIPRKYSNDIVNAAYTVLDGSVDDIKPNLWICGHTHDTADITLKNGVHVVRNPIGYRKHYGYTPSEVSWDNWYNKIVEV